MASGEYIDKPSLAKSAPVERALEQSREVAAKAEECAEDINATNAAVQTRIADGAITLSAPKALAQGKKIEGKVQEVADDLHRVTETLAKGIDELRQLEVDLAKSRSALIESNAALEASTEAEKKALQNALHDSTTGLPNRDLFDIRLKQAISMAQRHRWTLAVMFLDLDRFKRINDVHGHAAGDAVLRETANRLREQAREEDTVCRNGGDEFLYLLVNPQGDDNIARIARSTLERISQPVSVAGREVQIGVSVGIAVYPGSALDPDELIRLADGAMYNAKRARTGYAFANAVGPGTTGA